MLKLFHLHNYSITNIHKSQYPIYVPKSLPQTRNPFHLIPSYCYILTRTIRWTVLGKAGVKHSDGNTTYFHDRVPEETEKPIVKPPRKVR